MQTAVEPDHHLIVADPKDVVGPALFFASPAADFVTDKVLYVDGGITASQ